MIDVHRKQLRAQRWLQDNTHEGMTPEPPQDTSLTKITAEYFMATDPDRVALQRKVLAWHKAERAKLFEQIRSEVIGDFDAHKAMKPQTMRIGNNGQIDHEWTDQDEDWKTIMIRDTLRVKQLEALTRLEKNEKVTE